VKRICAALGRIFLWGAIALVSLSTDGRCGGSAGGGAEAAQQHMRGLERAPENKTAGPEKRLALVIGNGAYQRAALAHATSDARLIADTLRKQGFRVLDYYDVDQNNMKLALRAFSDAIIEEGKNTIAFVYYAGHGVQVKSENYLIPVSENIQSEKDVDLEAIKVSSLMSMLENVNTRLNVVVLDACRNNPFQSSRSVGRGGLAQVTAPDGALGSLVAFSTAPNRVAMDDSPYAATLAQTLSEPGLSIDRAFMKVRGAVKAATKDEQIPWEQTSLTGEFFPAGKQTADAPTVSGENPPADAPSQGWLGVSVQKVSSDTAQRMGFKEPRGALIAKIHPTGPSAKANLKVGDVILDLNGAIIREENDLPAKAAALKSGSVVKLFVFRDGARLAVSVTLGASPGEEQLASLEAVETTKREAELKQREEEESRKERDAETSRKEAALKQREEDLRKKEREAEIKAAEERRVANLKQAAEQEHRDAAVTDAETVRMEAENKRREAEIARLEEENRRHETGGRPEAPTNRFRQGPPGAGSPRGNAQVGEWTSDNSRGNAARQAGLRSADDAQADGSTGDASSKGLAALAYCMQGDGSFTVTSMHRKSDASISSLMADTVKGCAEKTPEGCCKRNVRFTRHGCISVVYSNKQGQVGVGLGTERNVSNRAALSQCGDMCDKGHTICANGAYSKWSKQTNSSENATKQGTRAPF
jgi:hypothetical protein